MFKKDFSDHLNIPTANEQTFVSIDLALVKLVPEPFSRQYGLIPLRKAGAGVEVAMSDPENIAAVDSLKKLLKAEIVPILSARPVLERFIDKSYDALKKSGEMDTVISGLEFEIRDLDADETPDAAAKKKEVDDAPIVKLVNLILTDALKERATDIHIEPLAEKLLVRYRVDGSLKEMMTAPLKSHGGVVSRIKVIAKLNIAESRLPQDGRFALKKDGREVDIRVSILPTVQGEKIVLRLLDKGLFNFSLENLGFQAEDQRIFEKCIRRPYGIVIISGPTGSGKSTTLYSALKEIKSPEDNIVTVEDPVEYQLDGIAQVAANEKIGLTFAQSLRSVLRQDPDKILIGEIRDHETADIAMKFALTGHLVFTTLHANDTVSTVTRLIDLGIPPYLVGSSLVLVMAQRLVRKVCVHCKEEYQPSPKELSLLNLPAGAPGQKFFKGKGCDRCGHTGYFGRIGIFELLPVTLAIRQLIFRGADQEQLRQQALKESMRTLRMSALEKMALGLTSPTEVLKTTVEEL